MSSKVILLGWDAADWKIIHPLIDTGKLPNLQHLIEGGVMGNLRSLVPMLSPMLWTSIATGRTADQHGILGFLEPDPVSGSVRPVSSTSRKVKAIWNILNQSGHRPHAVGWFASHPAEPINGVYVSENFRRPVAPHGKPWPVAARSVHPAELEQTLAEFRIHPGDLTGDDLLPFVPELDKIDQEEDHRLISLAVTLAECITTHAVATHILENEEWDFVAVFQDAIDHICHTFMRYHPPRMDTISEEDFNRYRHVVTGIYRFHDVMLGRILELAGPEATVIIVSDHGFHSDHLRPTGGAVFGPEAPALWHRPHGIVCMAGPGIRRDELIHGATLLDITPTILTMFGLPVGDDMPGRPLVEVFEKAPVSERIPSWEDVPGDSGMPKSNSDDEDPWEALAIIQQLSELGYVEAPSESTKSRVEAARQHQDFNLARLHLAAGRASDALPLLERLNEERPNALVLQVYLAQAYFRCHRMADCRTVVEKILENEKAGNDRPVANVLMGNLCLAEGNTSDALEYLLRARKASRPFPALLVMIGLIYLVMKRWDDAESSFRDAMKLDRHLAAAHTGLAAALIGNGKLDQAAEEALEAVGLDYASPRAHFVLGRALAGLGQAGKALRAFQASLSLKPDNPAAHDWLAAIYEQAAHDAERAAVHRRQARELRDGASEATS